MIVTVEPGIYLPAFGVRCEVNVFVGDGEARVGGDGDRALLVHVDLGRGNPDVPPPAHVIEALIRHALEHVTQLGGRLGGDHLDRLLLGGDHRRLTPGIS